MSQIGPQGVADVLAEFDASGLDLLKRQGNSAKLRLMLDLAELLRERPLRVLDVGCGGAHSAFNLWEAFVPLADRVELTGVDVDQRSLQRFAARARDLEFPVQLRVTSAYELSAEFGAEAFDVVVSTQVLEHLRDWRRGLREMRDVVGRGGRLLLTCDSGEVRRTRAERARLRGKRVYARVADRAPLVRALASRAASGDWEQGLMRAELQLAAKELALDVERLAPYALSSAKGAMNVGGPRAHRLWLAFEESLVEEAGPALDASFFAVLYLRARRP